MNSLSRLWWTGRITYDASNSRDPFELTDRVTERAPVVRDLYAVVMHEGATKGTLVTTSGFCNDSYEFANDKPLTLISGGQLLYLLERHGHKAYIYATEIKKLGERWPPEDGHASLPKRRFASRRIRCSMASRTAPARAAWSN